MRHTPIPPSHEGRKLRLPTLYNDRLGRRHYGTFFIILGIES
jgi:hypothetical protein